MRKTRLGIVGYGLRGAGLLRVARGIDRLRPVAVCDENSEARSRAAGEFPDVRIFEHYSQMLSSGDVDAVAIETARWGFGR